MIMGARVFKEYAEVTKAAIAEYEKRFDTDFPDYYYEYEFPETDFESKIVEVINDCLEKGQDVFALGYLELADDTLY